MVIHKLKVILLHSTKCGGMSIRSSVLDHVGKSNVKLHKGDQKHLPLRSILKKEEISDIENWVVIILARNPFDRAVSEVRYQLKTQNLKNDLNYTTVSKAIESGAWLRNKWNWHGCSLAKMYRGSQEAKVVHIVRLEDIEEDWARVSRDVFGVELPLKHENRSKATLPQDLSQEAIERILSRWGRDFELFGYSDDPRVANRGFGSYGLDKVFKEVGGKIKGPRPNNFPESLVYDIIRSRRGYKVDDGLFMGTISDNIDLVSNWSPRWIVSVLDTIADVSDDDATAISALVFSSMLAVEKCQRAGFPVNGPLKLPCFDASGKGDFLKWLIERLARRLPDPNTRELGASLIQKLAAIGGTGFNLYEKRTKSYPLGRLLKRLKKI
tara:strand:+ start:987 stop:2132 length:1146 start_codon:yes stop_codon:yes gene_type:complete